MINRRPILAFALTAVLAVYLVFALSATNEMARAQPYDGCIITVNDTAHIGFISEADVAHEGGDIFTWIKTRPRGAVNLDSIERVLRGCDKIQDVNVMELNNGALAIDVTPMTPVARVFDSNISYYINAEGKRISADPHYHIDVPVVVGFFTAERPAKRLLPLLDYIAARPELDALVSTVKQARNGDIIIVPTIRGHVINFGDTANVDDKFERLGIFYRKVMPVRGWETYDTIAVKWSGRVVATRRNKVLASTSLRAVDEEFDDAPDEETMGIDHRNDSTLNNQTKPQPTSN